MEQIVDICGFNPLDNAGTHCPVCVVMGKEVSSKTLKGILNEEKIPLSTEGYHICLSTDCDVVYFGEHIFYKKDVKVKVWFKETGSSIPVCYCKNVTREEILKHILMGCCSDLKDIQTHTGANTGKKCLTQNPTGT